MAERCALFVIIALGESILVTGATAAALPMTTSNTVAFLAAFLGSVAMWWIYFNIGAERGSHRIASSDDPGRVARVVYTYVHVPIVAGIVVCAVADEIVISHPDGHVGLREALVIFGGPVLYLLGNICLQAREREQPAAVAPRGARGAGRAGAVLRRVLAADPRHARRRPC